MTQPVADQTPIPERTYRQHTDPPGLWIAVALSSISLHVLLFWLLRSHGLSVLQSNSSNAVPIEFITISAKQTPTKASPKRQPTAQKPQSAKPPKPVAPKTSAAKSSPPVEDRNAIAFTNTLQPSINEDVKPKNSKTQPQVAVEPEPTFQPDPEPTDPIPPEEQEPEPTPSPDTPQEPEPEPTPSPDTPQEPEPEPTPSPDTPQEPEPEPTPSSSPDEEQQPDPNSLLNPEENADTISQKPDNQENSARAFNPQNNTTDSSNLNPPPSETNNLPDNLPKTEGEVVPGKGTPLANLAQPVEPPKQPSSNTQRGGIGSWEIETGGVQKDIPENLAQPVGNIRQKELNISSNEKPTSEPITFQASLIIDSSGNLTDVYIPPNISEPQSSRYREYALELFKDQKFIPASSNGKKPPLSNLVVRITIQPKISDQ